MYDLADSAERIYKTVYCMIFHTLYDKIDYTEKQCILKDTVKAYILEPEGIGTPSICAKKTFRHILEKCILEKKKILVSNNRNIIKYTNT